MSAKISRRQLAKTVLRLLNEQPKRQKEILRAAAAYLVVHKRSNEWELLVNDMAKELFSRDKYLYARVKTPQETGVSEQQQIVDFLKSARKATTVELDSAVDPTLLTGVVISALDEQLDSSAKQKLMRLTRLSVNPVTEGVK